MSFLPWVDLHIHSTFSDGEGDLESIIRAAKAKNFTLIAVTDHFDPYQPVDDKDNKNNRDLQSFQHRFATAVREVYSPENPSIIFGAETGPFSSKALYEACAIVIGSAHYVTGYSPAAPIKGEIFNEKYWEAYQATVFRTLKNPYIDVIGHIEGYLPLAPLLDRQTTFEERREMEREIAQRYLTDRFWEEVIRNALKYGKALEVHGMTQTPRPCYLEKAIRAGVPVSMGSDAHRISDIGRVDWCRNILMDIGVDRYQLFLGRRCGKN